MSGDGRDAGIAGAGASPASGGAGQARRMGGLQRLLLGWRGSSAQEEGGAGWRGVVVQQRDVGLMEVDGAVGVVVAPEEKNKNQNQQDNQKREDGLEDGHAFAFVVLGSHDSMLMQVSRRVVVAGWVLQAGKRGAREVQGCQKGSGGGQGASGRIRLSGSFLAIRRMQS